MKTVLKKIIKTVLLGFLILIVLFLIVMAIYNRIMLGREKTLLKSCPGEFVEVDGKNMSIYVSGEGEHTLIFMSGAGITLPIYDYKPFTDRFEDDFRVVVIEKFGYGFSDCCDGPRDVGTRVRQDREALRAAGIDGSYILCPHSYSGLEAVYWAQNYPEEIEAIIGLDMAVPASYDSYDEKILSSVRSTDSLKRAVRKTGLIRLFVGIGSMPGYLTEQEKKAAVAVICSNYRNETVSAETDNIISDRSTVESKAVPDVPTLLIISDGTVTDGWIGFENDYASSLSDVTTVQLDCGHSVYDQEPDRCEQAMREFIAELDS
ncbi:MAG: alpha/beta hydrolase [Oscillospiraceae bacterium]|nr:alpha/beta hydrolase [Oscillospiraceae bacterium]